MSSVSNPQGGKTKLQANATSDNHSVVFFGYDLPDSVTKDDILLLLNEYKQTIINIEVVRKRKQNFAKITFVTSAAARAATEHYSGQYWYDFGVRIVLKPWEEKRKSHVLQNNELSPSDSKCKVNSYEGLELHRSPLDRMHSQSTASFLSPYPKLSDTTDTHSSDSLTDSHTYDLPPNSKEYTIKVYGLSLNVRKQEVNAMVIPFGDLTSPVKINRYPKNNVCYAYVNFWNQHSAIAAVTELNGSEFNGTKIHVCHKGQLEVDHNCRFEHRALNDGQMLIHDSVTMVSSNKNSAQLEASGTINKTDCFSVDHWNKLLYVSRDNTSVLSQLVKEFVCVKIDLDHNAKSVTFVGLKESVEQCRNKLFNEIYQSLTLSNYQILLLVTFVPNLVKDIKKNCSVTVTGFYEGSTCLNFKGDNIQMAYKYITEKVRLCRSKEFPCNIDSSLVKVAIIYIKRIEISVVICNTDGEKLLPILAKAKPTTVTRLVIHSLSQDDSEIDRAIAILSQAPYKRKLDLPFQYESHDLENEIEKLQSKYSVMVQTLWNSIVIQGYAKNDVDTVFEALQKMTDGIIKTIEYDCSKEEMQYLKHILFEKPTNEGKRLLEFLSKSLSLKVHNTSMSITLTGNLKAVSEGTNHIDQLLNNFLVKAVNHRCHSDFLSQIEKFIKNPLEKELNVVVYYFSVRGSKRFKPTESVNIYIKVYSTNSADFKKACDVLNNLDPKGHYFSLNQEEFAYIFESGTVDLCKIGDPYRVRIELQHDQNGVLMHAFTQKEAEDCFWSLKQDITSSLEVVSHFELTPLQLKYVQNNKSSVLMSPYIKIVDPESSLPKLKIQGSKLQVEKCTMLLQQLLSRIVTKSHKLMHHKYILMWKKCWQKVNEKISQDKELCSELTVSVSGDSITCKLVVAGENLQTVNNAILSAKVIDGSVKEYEISTDILSIKAFKDNIKSNNFILCKDLIYHIEFKSNKIIVLSPYCIQAEEVCKKVATFLSEEKLKRKIFTKQFEIEEYSCIIKQLQSHWSKLQEIAKNNKLLSISLVTDSRCAIEVKGNEAAIKQAEPQILQHILSLESSITCSVVPVDYHSRPALKSAELLQLCKELESELSVSISIQMQPEVLSSATVCSSSSDVTVEICEGSIALEKSDIFVNFTDGNLTLSKELKRLIGKPGAYYYKHYMECHGTQSAGKALCPSGEGYIKQKIIYAVMPKWIDGKSGESEAIISAVIASLKLAVKHKAKSISLPFLGCIDKTLPIDCLADACLTAVYLFSTQLYHIKIIRLVLPANMAKKFHEEFTAGLFREWIEEKKLDDDGYANTKSVDSVWLWKDDHGEYLPFNKKENSILNQESGINSNCYLTIGRFRYIVDFTSMTQTNTTTQKVRKIKHVTNDYVWAFLDDKIIWKNFAPQNSKEIEIMYITGMHHSLIIDGQHYSYDFSKMVQVNKITLRETPIQRMSASMLKPALETNESHSKSNIVIHGTDKDISLAKERLNSEIKSLVIVRCIDVQPKLTLEFGKHIKQIQNDYKVKISQCPATANNVDLPVKYNVIGFKGCVQEAITAVYQALTSISNSLLQSFPKPAEWEQQSNPIELKDVSTGSTEWKRILQRIQETIPSVDLISIKRIQNEFLWEKYCQHKERMSRKGPERVNEMELFHGSSSSSPEDIYMCEEGFDMRFSRSGMWGKGNYFAESARYSCSYAYKADESIQNVPTPGLYQTHTTSTARQMLYQTRTTSTVRQIFLVKVLTGDSFRSPSDKTLRMPPYKPSASSEKVRYDTVNGMAPGSKIYITYSNDKAYPLYLISLNIRNFI